MFEPNSFISAALALAPLLLASAFAAPAAIAQDGSGYVVVASAAESPIATAEQLRARAAELNGDMRNFGKMKRLYEAAARAAPENDLQRVNDLRRAGQIAFYMRDLPEAQRLLVSAAEMARDFGDVFQAGESYLDAAVATAQLGDAEYARDLLHRAKMLAQSPLLLPPYCDCLRKRVALLEGLESTAQLLEG